MGTGYDVSNCAGCDYDIFIFPHHLIQHWHRWGNFTDAIGLSAFAIQGALYAVKLDMPVSAVVVAAVLTGSGGGIVRDLLARRNH